MYASTRLVSTSRKIPKPLGRLRLCNTKSDRKCELWTFVAAVPEVPFTGEESPEGRRRSAALRGEQHQHKTQHNSYNCLLLYCCCAAAGLFYGMSHTTVTPPASLCTSRLIYTLIDCCLTPHALLLPQNLANWLSTDKGSQLEAYLEAICSSIYTS